MSSALPVVGDLRLDTIRAFRDTRGVLFPAELPPLSGFAPVRIFWVADVPVGMVRGQHGHRVCAQYLICCAGQIRVDVFDGQDERCFSLKPGDAVLLRPGLYATQTFETADALLLVLCDQPFDADDYLESREEVQRFRTEVSSRS